MTDAIVADVQPGADVGRQILRMKTVRGRDLLRCGTFRYGEHSYAGSEELEELAAGEIEMVNGASGKFVTFRLEGELLRWSALSCAHRALPCIILAAWRTASTMRGCVPHRQILPCKNCVTSSGLGFGLPCSKPTLLMIMPGVQ
jgi:hypothetical protein